MPEYTWDMKGYASKYGFYISENLSRREAERTLQLEPEPPKESDLNNYIIQAQQQKDLRYLSFFLHHYEKMLNGRIYSFWRSDGNERYDPERFLDYKMTCVVAVIERFSDYDPSTGADFTTYLYPFITDALLSCRMLEESWSVDSLDQYKKIRGIAWKYRTSGENTKKTISEYAVEKKSTLTADDRKRLTKNFAGYDISPDMVRLSRVNMYLHHFTKPKISEYDTLTSEEKWDDCYDVILANPPFMTPKGGIMPHSRYRVKAKRSEVLFVDYIAEHLNPTGRAAIIVPEGIVFQSANAYKELRKYLVDDGLLYAVISLPVGIFNPYSGVKTSILLIDKSFARLKDEILFVKLNNDGFDLGAQRREIEGSEIPEIIRIIQKYHADLEPQTADNDILHHPLVTIASKERVAEQDYILVGERYKVDKSLDSTYPVVPLSDICEINAENKNPTLAFGDDEFIYIDISSVENGTGKVDFSNKIKGTDAPSRAKRAVKKGDILFSTVRPNLKAYGYVEREDCDCCVASTGFAVISAKSMVLSKYVYYMLYSEPVQTQLSSMMGKGAYPSVNQKDVSQIQIPLPSLSIQEDFVAELDSYQKIIDGARQIVENYKPSIPISSSWEVIPLLNLCENLDSKRIPITSSDRETGDVPYYGASGIVDYVKDYIFDEPLLLISEDGANLLARSTPIAFSISGKTWVNNHAHVLKFNNIYTQRFVEFYINQVDISQYITGAAQPKLSQANLNKICIPCPNIEVQEEIVRAIESVIHIVEQNKRLIAIFEQKMADKISEIWGEKQ